jgi:tetratricopeptide (TPR) repeat protein
MNHPMKFLLLLPAVALLFACGGEKKESATDVASRIRAMEDSVFESMSFDRRRAQALLDVYKVYASAYPNDTLAPEYLFRAANVAKSMHEGEESIKLYDRLLKDYPSWRRLPDVLYLKAFTIDSELGRKGEAETAYRQVISTYPDHPFAKDAKVMIDNLHYTDEELIQRFQAMQDSAQAVR